MHMYLDLDGTIIDPRRGMLGSLKEALVASGRRDLAQRDLSWAIGPPVFSSLRRLLGCDRRAALALAHYRRHYGKEERLLDFTAYLGMSAAVRSCKHAGYQLHLCTMKPSEYAVPILEKLEIRDLFESVIAPRLNEDPVTKADLLHRAAEKRISGLGPGLLVGDRGSDMEAARAHGLRAIGVAWGFGTHAELRRAGATDICSGPQELLGLAKRTIAAERQAAAP